MDKKAEKFRIDFEKLKKKIGELESEANKKTRSEENNNDESAEDVSELEKNLDFSRGNLDFNQISWPSLETENSAPVLEKIAGEQVGPVFVGMIPQRLSLGASSENNEKDEIKYIPDFNTGDEPKYVSNPEKVNTRPDRVDFLRVGREQINPARPTQEVQQVDYYNSNKESSKHEREKVWKPEKFDIEKAGRENPMEREEANFKKYKPKLPDKNY